MAYFCSRLAQSVSFSAQPRFDDALDDTSSLARGIALPAPTWFADSHGPDIAPATTGTGPSMHSAAVAAVGRLSTQVAASTARASITFPVNGRA
ncbi:MAG: hypothetical protein ACYS7M_07955, partial [Planctomycetota bacterium]